MPHELRGLQNQPHEFFTYVLTAGGLIGLLIVGFVGYLMWRDRRRLKRPGGPAPASRPPRKRKRR